jgi:hypothetical protein
MSDMPLPVLYMDFDGVLAFKGSVSQYQARADLGDVHENENALSLSAIRELHWSGELVERLRALPADWVWLTSWFEVAQRELDPMLQVKSASSLFWTPDIDQYDKWEALVRDQNRNPRPFVWADDVATEFFDASELLTWVPHLVLTPDEEMGLTRADLDAIQTFFEDYGLS